MRFEVARSEAATVVRGQGTLGSATVAATRETLLKCLAEHPRALIVDLGDVTVADLLSLTVLASVARQASTWPGVPFAVVVTDPAVADHLASSGPGPTYGVWHTVGQALDALDQHEALVTFREFLPPLRGAARHARSVVTEACVRWDLEQLIGSACVVVTELVTNAVRHADTTMWLRVSRRGRRLLLAVEDGGQGVPVRLPMPAPDDPAPGRGLALVDEVADRWGHLRTAHGKVVWVALHG